MTIFRRRYICSFIHRVHLDDQEIDVRVEAAEEIKIIFQSIFRIHIIKTIIMIVTEEVVVIEEEGEVMIETQNQCQMT